MSNAARRPCGFVGSVSGYCCSRRRGYWLESKPKRIFRVTLPTRRLSTNGFLIRCSNGKQETPNQVERNRDKPIHLLDTFSNLFPLWIVFGSCLAFVRPACFTWFSGSCIIWTLALIMLAMGLTLDIQQLVQVTRNPYPVVVGAVAQYTIMPILGFIVSRLFALPSYFAVGVCLVACCPGGTASNLVCYLAQANVALSVLMTTVTTFLSVLVTPWLMLLLAGTLVPIHVKSLLLSTLQVVLIPLIVGCLLRLVFPRVVRRLQSWLPTASVIGVVLICASIVGENAYIIRQSGLRLMLALAVLHWGGFWLGYWVSKWVHGDEQVCRTIAIEVGMQNSGLGAALATAHFHNPLTAVPCAISATMHSVCGSLLAGYWRWKNNVDRQRYRR